MLSKHQNRIRLPDVPEVAALCDDYAAALCAAGHADSVDWPYSYDETHGGVRLDALLRDAYRQATDDGVEGSPFDAEGERALYEWCNGPATEKGAAHGITRYIELLYLDRPDLRWIYKDLGDPGTAAGLLDWARAYGSHEVPIPDQLVPGAAAASNGSRPAPAAAAEPARVGVNVAGYLHSELGVGEVARQIVGRARRQRRPARPGRAPSAEQPPGHDFGSAREIASPFDVNLICVNADGLPDFAHEAGPEFFADRYSIGVWWWELERVPRPLERVVRHARRDLGRQPLRRRRADRRLAGTGDAAFRCRSRSPARSRLTARRSGSPTASPSYSPSTTTACFSRKNPLGAVEAFKRAFGPDEDVHLVAQVDQPRARPRQPRPAAAGGRFAPERPPDLRLPAGRPTRSA